MAISKILVPVDGSASASAAARFGVQLAKDVGASVTLMYVFDAPAVASLGIVAKGNLDETKENVSRGSFSAARDAIGQTDIHISEFVEIGHPAQCIVDYATRCGFGMIVMGRRGRSHVKELLIGSVSEHVTRTAPCPVTVVHA
jgi:nucleotide-binding universal stress UspA family protein